MVMKWVRVKIKGKTVGRYGLYSKRTGERLPGTRYYTKGEKGLAKQRLREVEAFKHMGRR